MEQAGRNRRVNLFTPWFLSQCFHPPYFKYFIGLFPHPGPSSSPNSQDFLFSSSILSSLIPPSPQRFLRYFSLLKIQVLSPLRSSEVWVEICLILVVQSYCCKQYKWFKWIFVKNSLNAALIWSTSLIFVIPQNNHPSIFMYNILGIFEVEESHLTITVRLRLEFVGGATEHGALFLLW